MPASTSLPVAARVVRVAAAADLPVAPSSPPDRKSTRLNSSHVEISYAVFCLKKKIEPYDEGADGGEGRVENVHLVLLGHLPPAARVKGVGRALVDEAGHGCIQTTVDHVVLAG